MSLRLAAALSALPLLLVLLFGWRGLAEVAWTALPWDPPQRLGALGLVLGTALTAAGGAALATVVGEGAGLQMAFAGRRGRSLRLLAATPAAVLAAALLGGGLGLLHRLGLGQGLALAALGLAPLAIPSVADGVQAAAAALRPQYLGALALGLGPEAALGALRPGLRRALLRLFAVALARLSGEAALVSVLIGGAGGLPRLFGPSGALGATLLAELPQAPPGGRWTSALGALALAVAALGALAGLLEGRAGDDAAAGR